MMSPTVSLKSNQVVLVYQIPGDEIPSEPDRTLRSFAESIGDALPPLLLDACSDRYADELIWQAVPEAHKTSLVSPDIEPTVRKLLSGHSPKLVSRWSLTPFASRLIKKFDFSPKDTNVSDRSSYDVLVSLDGRAATRLNKAGVVPSPLQISFLEIELIRFDTGLGFLVATVDAARTDKANTSLIELQETVHALSRFNKCYWAKVESSENVTNDTRSLGTILRALVHDAGDHNRAADRAVTYTYAELSEPVAPDVLDGYATYLARRYTTDYLIDPQRAQMQRIGEFTNLRHAICQEGAATLQAPVADYDQPHFLAEWPRSTLKQAYLPILLLKLHENWYLSQLQLRASHLDNEEEDIDAFTRIIEDALIFRQFYRFSYVGGITMHALMAKALRDVWSLDTRLAEMDSDVRAVAERLSAANVEDSNSELARRERVFFNLGIISSAALAGLTAFTIAKEVLDVVLAPDAALSQEIGVPADPDLLMARVWSIVAGVAIAVVTAGVLFAFRPRSAKVKRHSAKRALTARLQTIWRQ